MSNGRHVVVRRNARDQRLESAFLRLDPVAYGTGRRPAQSRMGLASALLGSATLVWLYATIEVVGSF